MPFIAKGTLLSRTMTALAVCETMLVNLYQAWSVWILTWKVHDAV
jgi:hypothetical protein